MYQVLWVLQKGSVAFTEKFGVRQIRYKCVDKTIKSGFGTHLYAYDPSSSGFDVHI